MHKDSKDRPQSQVGYIREPYHVPGYTGHIPTKQYRHGASFGNVSRKILEDPSVAQAPIPLLLPPVQVQKDLKNSKCTTEEPSSKEQQRSGQPPKEQERLGQPPKTKLTPSNCGKEEDYGIQVYQLPYWPKAKDPCGDSESPLNVDVQEMLSAITPLPYLTQRDLTPQSPGAGGTKRDQKDCKGEGNVDSRSIGIQYSDKRDKQHKKNAKKKEDNRSRKLVCNGRRAANRKGHDCSQIQLERSPSSECAQAGENQNDLKVSPIKNRSPYVNSSYEEPLDTRIFRPSEGLPAAYSGHVPGKKFRSDGRSFGKVSCETKDFMESYGMFPVT